MERKENIVTKNEVCVHHPFRMIVSGASGVGKTMFIKNFFENLEDISQQFGTIIFSYSVDQPIYDDLKKSVPNIVWLKGLSASDLEEYLLSEEGDKLLIIDDQMVESTASAFLVSLFTKLSHHTNTSIIFVVQNMFFQGKFFRTISLNATCFCIFKNPRDQRQITFIAGQICPWNPKYVCEAFKDATKDPFSYLFIDLRPDLEDSLRIRAKILDPDGQIVYLEK
jgi:GTPase SAR1 family protein